MIGTADESAERGIKVRRPAGTRSQRAAAATSARRRHARRQRLQPGVLSRPGGRDDAGRHLNAVAALQLSAPPNVLGRRAVLHHRDDHDDGLRRLQLRSPGDVAAPVRRHVDVRWGDHDRVAGRVHRRRAAVAPLRVRVRPPAGATPAQSRHRRRIERPRDAGGHRPAQGGLRRRGHRDQRRQPIPVRRRALWTCR